MRTARHIAAPFFPFVPWEADAGTPDPYFQRKLRLRRAGSSPRSRWAMQIDDRHDDIQLIEALITRQFASLNWTADRGANWPVFVSDFYLEASLYPSARPARRQTVQEFVERMQGLAATTLCSFAEE